MFLVFTNVVIKIRWYGERIGLLMEEWWFLAYMHWVSLWKIFLYARRFSNLNLPKVLGLPFDCYASGYVYGISLLISIDDYCYSQPSIDVFVLCVRLAKWSCFSLTRILYRSFYSKFCVEGYVLFKFWRELCVQVSYMILQRVSPVTHSVGNCVKRVVVIVTSVLFFRTPVSPINSLGTTNLS